MRLDPVQSMGDVVVYEGEDFTMTFMARGPLQGMRLVLGDVEQAVMAPEPDEDDSPRAVAVKITADRLDPEALDGEAARLYVTANDKETLIATGVITGVKF